MAQEAVERMELSRRRLLGLGAGLAAGGLMHGVTVARAQSVATPVAESPDLRVRFVRHAESQINELGAIEASGQPLPPDSGVTYPLTQRGVEEAIALAA